MQTERIEQQHGAMRAEIKTAARTLLEADGLTAVSMRAVARALNVTAPSLYYYFPNLEALLTALIVDSFDMLAAALTTAAQGDTPGARLLALTGGYRAWATANTPSFELLFGTPVKGYAAPPERTIPAAIRAYLPIVNAVADTYAKRPPDAAPVTLPEPTRAHMELLRARDGYTAPAEALYITAVLWTRMHGAVTLELHGMVTAVAGDPAALYDAQMRATLHDFALLAAAH